MKEHREIFSSRIFTNDEIKKLQEETNGTEKNQHFINRKLDNMKKKHEKNVKIKENDYESIREKLNDIFRKYYERLSERKITTLEEFYDMILVSFVLYEHLEKISFCKEDKNDSGLLEFRNNIKKYNELKAQRAGYNKYDRKYFTDKEIQRYNAEIERLDAQIDHTRKEITQFTNVFLSGLWADYENFKDFIQDSEKISTLAQLTELNHIFGDLEEINIFENYNSIRNKLENYFADIDHFEFPIDEEKDIRGNIENILDAFNKENDIIDVMLHFAYANILIRNNIIKFPIISEEYSENSDIIQEINALKYDILNYYRDALTYRDGIKIDDSVIESHNDVLFYDLLYLQHNKESSIKKDFRTFDNLHSSKESYSTGLKTNNSKITIDGDNVTINCNIDDFIQISNSLEMIEKLKAEEMQKNFLVFFDKDDEYYENRKFKPKGKFMSERVNILKRMETVTEIEKKLLEKNVRLISSERRLIYSLLEKTENESEDFKSDMLKIFENPSFITKIIKNENIEKNSAYSELLRKISGGE